MPKPRQKTSTIWKVSDAEFRKLIKNSRTYTEALSFFGMKNVGHNSVTLKKRIAHLGLSVEHFSNDLYRKRQPLDDVLVKNSTYTNMVRLKVRLLNDGLLKNKCYACGLGNIWKKKPIVHHLDHINGEHTDNRIDNLRLLCPNCHSQSETYCGRNKNKGS